MYEEDIFCSEGFDEHTVGARQKENVDVSMKYALNMAAATFYLHYVA